MSADPLCRHEFDDSSVCAGDALPGSTRCAGHQGDGQPDIPVVQPAAAAVGAAGTAGAR